MVNTILHTLEEKMKISVKAFKNELSTIRTGHASPALVEHVKVDYAGVPTPLYQMASITAPEARLLVIQPWDKTVIRDIEKAILKTDLGLNPTDDGSVIRIGIPPLSEERRRELTMVVKKKAEERKIMVRNLRHESLIRLKDLEKNKEISQDENRRAAGQLQKLTDLHIEEIEEIARDKEAELLEV
ncbi:MAG: ribosome recycling factor [Chloroflexi bacterium]|nr:ribosome recycling factor [Chloroflexota bacterium]